MMPYGLQFSSKPSLPFPGLLDVDTSDTDADASDTENVDHFRHKLSSAIKRITEMCNTWEDISEKTVLPDSVQV